MIYRKFGKTNIMLSALGIGTNFYKSDKPEDIDELVQLVREGIKRGINYIDVGYRYYKGKSEEIVKQALKNSGKNVHVTAKVTWSEDKTADAAYKRICGAIKNMGLYKATFFVAWNILNLEEFEKIIAPGGVYEGALRAKKEGLVDYLCMSIHAGPDDIIKMLDYKLFDGITIACSVLNQRRMQKALLYAEKLGVGIITMNSLGGGLIPKNPGFFSFIKQSASESVPQAALRYLYAHPNITTMLSGMTTIAELEENLEAVNYDMTSEDAENRINRVNTGFNGLKGFCSGCRYCDGCPNGINVFYMMQAYNMIFLTAEESLYRHNGKRLLENINICKKLYIDYMFIPETTENPCLKCGECEKKCTQSIPIMDRLDELYKRFEEAGFSLQYRTKRIKELIPKGYGKVAFYPGAKYTTDVLQELRKALPDLKSDIYLFDGNEKIWGQSNCGIEIRNPAALSKIRPDMVIISNYMYEDEIFKSLKYLEEQGIMVKKLHKINDVPWNF
jgi:predicted aldo/keto reductase-like oxidoreductase